MGSLVQFSVMLPGLMSPLLTWGQPVSSRSDNRLWLSARAFVAYHSVCNLSRPAQAPFSSSAFVKGMGQSRSALWEGWARERALAAHRFALFLPAARVALLDTMGLCLPLGNEIMSSLRRGWGLCCWLSHPLRTKLFTAGLGLAEEWGSGK